MTHLRLAPLTLVAAALSLGAETVVAQPSLPPVNLGATSFLDGGPPAGPGIYGVQYLMRYESSRFNDANGAANPGIPNPHLEVWTSLTQVIFMSEKKVFGANLAVDAIIPIVGIDFSKGPGGAPLTATGFGVGDLVVGPALQFQPIMGAHGPLFVHRFEAQVILPTGTYDRQNAINPGSGYLSVNPYWAGTFFFGPKLTASFRAHYLWNDENNRPESIYGPFVTRTQAGQAVHINFATEYEVIDHLRVGLNGYWLRQVTDGSINGLAVPGQEQVLGLGPGLIYSFNPKQHLFFNSYFETAVQNRPEGFRLGLRYVQKF